MPLHRKKLRPDLAKVCGFPAAKARFPAIFRNFAGQPPHIRQGLSSEQFCVVRSSFGTVMAGLVPAIHASPRGTKNMDARDKPGHDEPAASHTIARRDASRVLTQA
ncbi:hypothetical protein ACFQZO_23380 [Bradyrhizobium sp. GCM10027634]|uniref:hypothetical protein n=1 Tax=unclassified Bradyrhizobium TaxID=2631580 RepID=UPI00188CB4AA|nr:MULTISPECIES: hypothetical protein [unclassified Bradyrhizobium]MDN5003783.1 hypothetical protein [Bradyrhizobium sp. WYCCWR 12677]